MLFILIILIVGLINRSIKIMLLLSICGTLRGNFLAEKPKLFDLYYGNVLIHFFINNVEI